MIYVLLLVYTACSASGLILLKKNLGGVEDAISRGQLAQVFSPGLFAGAALYAVSFGMWLFIVSRAAISSVFPIAMGLSVIAIMAGSVFALGEHVGLLKAVGTGLVLLGIGLIMRTGS